MTRKKEDIDGMKQDLLDFYAINYSPRKLAELLLEEMGNDRSTDECIKLLFTEVLGGEIV